jgi:hypothetical protein
MEPPDTVSSVGRRKNRKGQGRKRALTSEVIARGRAVFRNALTADPTLRKGRDRAVVLLRRLFKPARNVSAEILVRDIILPELRLK